MAASDESFGLKRGEDLHNTSMIKHNLVLHVETPRRPSNAGRMAPLVGTPRRASQVGSTPGVAPLAGASSTKPMKTKYTSAMQRARQEKKRGASGTSKDWDEASTSSASSSSQASSLSNGGTPPSKPPRMIPYSGGLIPASDGLDPSSGYGGKLRDSTVSEGLSGSGRLPKFGVWDNKNEDSGPCYTLLFQNAAQEKKVGGPVRIHANRPASPARCEDLYDYNPARARKNTQLRQHSWLCCFVGS